MTSRTLPYPKSFPDPSEQAFLEVLLAPSSDFAARWEAWKATNCFEDLEQPIRRILPLLYLRLREAEIHDECSERIRGVYKVAWVKNQRLLAAVAQTTGQLEAAGINVVLLKGIPLLLTVYEDVGARALNDADLYIDPQHLTKAIRLLRSAGWTRHAGRFPLIDHFSNESLARIAKEITLANDQYIEVDLHWRVFDDLVDEQGNEILPFADLWARATPFDYKGVTYHRLSPEDMLIHIIVHGAEGNPIKTLRWVADAAHLVKKEVIDWERVMERTDRYGLALEMRLALGYLSDHGFALIPSGVLERLTQVPLSHARIRAYYWRANHAYKPLGSLPRHWRTYRDHEAPTQGLFRFVGFPRYLYRAWGFTSLFALLSFVVQKYTLRLKHAFSNTPN